MYTLSFSSHGLQKVPHPSIGSSPSSSFKKLVKLRRRKQISSCSSSGFVKTAFVNLLDAIVDLTFKFVEQPVLNEGNFMPVDEIGDAVALTRVEGKVPDDFPKGIYMRTGANHLYPDQTAAVSIFGTTKYSWVEGDGMIHAIYFDRDEEGKWCLSYKNRYVEAETFLLEKGKKKPLFLPVADGDPAAIIAAAVLNMMRFGKVVKDYNNTNVIEHGGRVFTIMEGSLPYEINPSNLDTLKAWDINGAWDGAFTAHPKKAPKTGEMVTMKTSRSEPYYVLGVISADGEKLLHKADVKLKAGALIHDVGVTENYNIILDYPLRIGADRLINGKPFIGFEKGEQSRIGVMPRYGNADSIIWFNVESNCSFHIINSFEHEDEVIVRCCRGSDSVIPGLDNKINRAEWYRRAYLPADEKSVSYEPDVDGVLVYYPYEWRLNIKTREVIEGYITDKKMAMDFPVINNHFMGCKSKYAYTQVVDSVASANTGIPKFKMFAKVHFDEKDKDNGSTVKIEYHALEDRHYCSGLAFVEKPGGVDEDDGWLICYVHDEATNISKVYIIDAKKFTEEPVSRIILPRRVPYGFHSMFLHDK